MILFNYFIFIYLYFQATYLRNAIESGEQVI